MISSRPLAPKTSHAALGVIHPLARQAAAIEIKGDARLRINQRRQLGFCFDWNREWRDGAAHGSQGLRSRLQVGNLHLVLHRIEQLEHVADDLFGVTHENDEANCKFARGVVD